MPPKSALSAALAGGTPINTVPTPTNKSSLGNLSWCPCLWGEGQAPAGEPTEQFDDPYETTVVGSFPTRTSLPSGKQLVSGRVRVDWSLVI
jgi:hypothetical protein